ncbi:hypothetical protein NTE10_000178 [Vibrio harveyi]|nr:hypothetical protein [Vibrio harveyi]
MTNQTYKFDAVSDFNTSLNEVETLAKVANAFDKLDKQDKRSLLLRSAVLFLGTHLECLFESIAEEYVYKIEQMQLSRCHLPEKLILSSLQHNFTDELIKKVKSGNPRCKEDLVKLAKIIECDQPVTDINLDTRFSYGKHGSGIVEKLFSRLDIDDIFEKCTVTTKVESILSDELEDQEVNIKQKFNVLTGIRNGLIHENKSPNFSTFNAILGDIPHYRAFATALDNLLDGNLNSILENSKTAA